MTQDERWRAQWSEVMDFMESNHRRPSKHRIEEQEVNTLHILSNDIYNLPQNYTF